MSTKAELEVQVTDLKREMIKLEEHLADEHEKVTGLEAQVAQLQESIKLHGGTIDEMNKVIVTLEVQVAKWEARYTQETSDEIQAIEARRCINCGYSGRVSYDGETEKFTCAACNHSWGMAEEQSPHRKR